MVAVKFSSDLRRNKQTFMINIYSLVTLHFQVEIKTCVTAPQFVKILKYTQEPLNYRNVQCTYVHAGSGPIKMEGLRVEPTRWQRVRKYTTHTHTSSSIWQNQHTIHTYNYTVIIANTKHEFIHSTLKIFIVELQKYCVSKPVRYLRLTYNVRKRPNRVQPS